MTNLTIPYVLPVKKRNKAGKVIRVYYYFRREGWPFVRLPGEPGSPVFMDAYRRAFKHEPLSVGASRAPAGSINALAIEFYKTSRFTELSRQSQDTYRRLLDAFRAKHGDKPVAGLQAHHIYRILDGMSATPAQANALRNVLRQLLQFGFERGWRGDNPVRDVRKLQYKKAPYPTWTEEHIAAYEARWPIGSTARLALGLLIYTGQRRGDMLALGPKHVRDGHIELVQMKTARRLAIPLHPELAEIIAASKVGEDVFLLSELGRPFASGDSFANRFAKWCVAAGLPAGLSPHGLRKSAARRLAEAGCSANKIAAITGHATLGEVSRYTAAADQRILAGEAVRHLGRPVRVSTRRD